MGAAAANGGNSLPGLLGNFCEAPRAQAARSQFGGPNPGEIVELPHHLESRPRPNSGTEYEDGTRNIHASLCAPETCCSCCPARQGSKDWPNFSVQPDLQEGAVPQMPAATHAAAVLDLAEAKDLPLNSVLPGKCPKRCSFNDDPTLIDPARSDAVVPRITNDILDPFPEPEEEAGTGSEEAFRLRSPWNDSTPPLLQLEQADPESSCDRESFGNMSLHSRFPDRDLVDDDGVLHCFTEDLDPLAEPITPAPTLCPSAPHLSPQGSVDLQEMDGDESASKGFATRLRKLRTGKAPEGSPRRRSFSPRKQRSCRTAAMDAPHQLNECMGHEWDMERMQSDATWLGAPPSHVGTMEFQVEPNEFSSLSSRPRQDSLVSVAVAALKGKEFARSSRPPSPPKLPAKQHLQRVSAQQPTAPPAGCSCCTGLLKSLREALGRRPHPTTRSSLYSQKSSNGSQALSETFGAPSFSCWSKNKADPMGGLSCASFSRVSTLTEPDEEYFRLLREIPCLAGAVEECAGAVDRVAYGAGEDVCVEGQHEGLLFVVCEGECEMLRGDQCVRILKRGDWVGEAQLMKNLPAEHTLRSLGDGLSMLVLDFQKIEGIVNMLHRWSAQGGSPTCNRRARPDLHRTENLGALGEGHFGTVVLLRDNTYGTHYALKAMSKQEVESEGAGQSVQHERNVMMLLESDFIVRLFQTFHDRDNIYFLMEPIMGGDLFELYQEEQLFGSVSHARFYLACVTMGLQHMHERNVAYRDLKLENCLVDDSGYVKLTDMGIAKVVVGKTYTVCGTADYFAPETLRQKGHDCAVDWWAAGVLLFIMATGRSPFDAPKVTTIYRNIVKGISQVEFPPMPADCEELVRALCRKRPEERIPMKEGGVESFKRADFFEGFRWEELEWHALPAPSVPGAPDMERIAERKLSRNVDMCLDTIQEWDGSLAP